MVRKGGSKGELPEAKAGLEDELDSKGRLKIKAKGSKDFLNWEKKPRPKVWKWDAAWQGLERASWPT